MTTIKGIGIWWYLSHKIYGETTNTFGSMTFQIPQNLPIKAKRILNSREARSLVSDFMLNSILKQYSKLFLWNPWNVLRRMHKRKKEKRTFSVHSLVGTIKSLPVSKCLILHTLYKSYRISGDLTETIN